MIAFSDFEKVDIRVGTIANVLSECLVLGFYKDDAVILLSIDDDAENGAKVC